MSLYADSSNSQLRKHPPKRTVPWFTGFRTRNAFSRSHVKSGFKLTHALRPSPHYGPINSPHGCMIARSSASEAGLEISVKRVNFTSLLNKALDGSHQPFYHPTGTPKVSNLLLSGCVLSNKLAFLGICPNFTRRLPGCSLGRFRAIVVFSTEARLHLRGINVTNADGNRSIFQFHQHRGPSSPFCARLRRGTLALPLSSDPGGILVVPPSLLLSFEIP